MQHELTVVWVGLDHMPTKFSKKDNIDRPSGLISEMPGKLKPKTTTTKKQCTHIALSSIKALHNLYKALYLTKTFLYEIYINKNSQTLEKIISNYSFFCKR